jgi:hypothetical protein
LIREAGLHADRLSVNIELPSEDSLRRLAGDKTYRSVLEPMGVIRETILETREMRSYSGPFPRDFEASNAYFANTISLRLPEQYHQKRKNPPKILLVAGCYPLNLFLH